MWVRFGKNSAYTTLSVHLFYERGAHSHSELQQQRALRPRTGGQFVGTIPTTRGTTTTTG